MQRDVAADKLLDPCHGARLAVVEIVDDGHVVPGLLELNDRVRTDEAGPTGDENMHERTLLSIVPDRFGNDL
ncbi:hypothetical protein GCM10022376_16360 [Yimella lutea]